MLILSTSHKGAWFMSYYDIVCEYITGHPISGIGTQWRIQRGFGRTPFGANYYFTTNTYEACRNLALALKVE
jgi:hypothetical protein